MSASDPTTQTQGRLAESPTHPEEIRASLDLRIGSSMSLGATLRTTPAGLVTARIMVSAIILATAHLLRVTGRCR